MACRWHVNVQYIEQLIDYQLNRNDGGSKDLYAQYVARLFDTYCEDTTEVIIRLSLMDQSHKEISGILMDKDRLNLLKIIRLFPNCKRITLCDGYTYQLVPSGVGYNDTILQTIEHCLGWVDDKTNYSLNCITLQTKAPIKIKLWQKHTVALNGWNCDVGKSNEDDDDAGDDDAESGDDDDAGDEECEYRISR
eukprot:727434_1